MKDYSTPEMLAMSPKNFSDVSQVNVADWVARSWGYDCLNSLPERVRRVLEEAVELHQAEIDDVEDAVKMVRYVYARAKGEPLQEAAGVAVTLLGYAQSKGFSLYDVTQAEIARVLAKPIDQLRAKHAAKTAAGVSEIVSPDPETEPPFVVEPAPLDLKRFGYAPGNYMIICRTCAKPASGCDKRATCCKPCAEEALQLIAQTK